MEKREAREREASVIVGEGSRTRGEGGCEWAQPVGAPAEPVESGEVRVRRRCEAVRSGAKRERGRRERVQERFAM